MAVRQRKAARWRDRENTQLPRRGRDVVDGRPCVRVRRDDAASFAYDEYWFPLVKFARVHVTVSDA